MRATKSHPGVAREEIQALPSYYRGNVFRSRTEARWAVFLDEMGIRWEYEPEGFQLPDGVWYLPDFWAPDMGIWVEVKPDDGPTPAERSKAEQLVIASGKPLLLLAGAPWPKPYELLMPDEMDDGTQLVHRLSVGFIEKYTGSKESKPHDGRPRMYFDPAQYELDACEVTVHAMEKARRAKLTEPEPEHYLPLGWEGERFEEGTDIPPRARDVAEGAA